MHITKCDLIIQENLKLQIIVSVLRENHEQIKVEQGRLNRIYSTYLTTETPSTTHIHRHMMLYC